MSHRLGSGVRVPAPRNTIILYIYYGTPRVTPDSAPTKTHTGEKREDSKRVKTLVALKGALTRFPYLCSSSALLPRALSRAAPKSGVMPSRAAQLAKRALATLLGELADAYGVSIDVKRESPNAAAHSQVF